MISEDDLTRVVSCIFMMGDSSVIGKIYERHFDAHVTQSIITRKVPDHETTCLLLQFVVVNQKNILWYTFSCLTQSKYVIFYSSQSKFSIFLANNL